MDGITHYLTTDLDLYSTEDLAALAAGLEVRGFAIVRPLTRFGREWHCGFSLRRDAEYDEPEPQIAAMLAAIEALDSPLRSAWAGCSLRLFDVGYDCGREPFVFRQELSTETLARLAAVGATVRVTLYADREEGPAGPPTAADRGGV
jgi:hypothetical protein